MSTNLDEVIEFLTIAKKKGLLNDNTAGARITACNKLFSVLDEEQRNVEYVRDHLDVIKAQFQNLNKDVMGQTIDVYANRAQLALDGFAQWKTDRAGWERDAAARTTRPAGAEKKARGNTTSRKISEDASAPESATGSSNTPGSRVVKIPLSSGFEASVTLPYSDVTKADIRRIAWALLAYAKDFDFATGSSPGSLFTMLDSENGRAGV